MFKTIIWATDGSESADRALPYVKDLAREDEATVLVVHCVEYVMGPRSGGVTVHADEDELQAKVAGQVAELKEAGIDAEEKTVGGSTLEGPAQRIANVARDAGAELIVAGTRGHTPFAGLLLGSVTERLMHVAPCPVLAVPSVRGGKGKQSETTAATTA
jgi:nucleotide-binding universal stress UspA family protein